MNYRKLTKEELIPLEKEFIEFLVVNGITAPDWEEFKNTNTEKAEQMIELFSEVIFEGIFRKAKFLMIKSSGFIYTYQCLVDKMIWVGIESQNPQWNFLENHPVEDHLKNDEGQFSIFMTEKPYQGKREHELFQMTEKGCEIADGEMFKKLSLAYIENKKND